MRDGMFAIAVLLLAGCAKPEGEQPAAFAQDGELSGEVFIVTAGAQSIKLGLVTVVAIPEKEITAFIEQKRADVAKLKSERQADIAAAENAMAVSRKSIAAAEAASRAAANAANDALQRFRKVTNDGWLRTMEHPEIGQKEADESDRYEHEVKVEQAKVAAIRKELATQQARLVKLRAEQLETSDYYFAGLPAGITSAKTNADGLFSMKVPKHGRYALAARASRQVFGETEKYFWLVWASPDGVAGKRIFLSNDNLTTVASPDVVITLPE